MIICKACETECRENSTFCDGCGGRFQEIPNRSRMIKCACCGKDIKFGLHHCGNCEAQVIYRRKVYYKKDLNNLEDWTFKFNPNPIAIIFSLAGFLGIIYCIINSNHNWCLRKLGSQCSNCDTLMVILGLSISAMVIGIWLMFKKSVK